MVQFVGNLGEHCHLAGRQFDKQRHQHLLAFGELAMSLAQNLLEQHALVRDVLVDDPEALRVDGEDE